MLCKIPHGSNCPSYWRPGLSAARSGAMALEAAFVYPILLLVLVGLIIGGIGVFRYQLVTTQAREAARWASVRGSGWAEATGKSSPSENDVLTQSVLPLALGMDPNKLSVQVEWIDTLSGEVHDWDKATRQPASQNASGILVTNRVRVTVTYQWFPEAFFAGPYNLRSVSEMPMSF